MTTTYYPHTDPHVTRLMEIGFTFDEAQKILAWWTPSEHSEWLMTASAEDIRDTSVDALN